MYRSVGWIDEIQEFIILYVLFDTLYVYFGSGRCRGPYFLVAEQESKQRSQLRGGVDRKAYLFIVTSLSCGGPTLSHPPLRTPPGPRLSSGQRSGERDGVRWNQIGGCQKVNCPAGAREATLGCAALRLAMTA